MTPEEISAAPKIKLGEIEYPIPMLAPRQARIVLPKGLALMKALAESAGTPDAAEISAQQYDDLLDVVYTACTRAEPTLKREEFLDRQTTLFELMTALNTVMLQSGLPVATDSETAAGG